MGYAETDVRYGHKADMLNALTNFRFWGKADSDQPLLIKVHDLAAIAARAKLTVV